jgi:hypothetical protein
MTTITAPPCEDAPRAVATGPTFTVTGDDCAPVILAVYLKASPGNATTWPQTLVGSGPSVDVSGVCGFVQVDLLPAGYPVPSTLTGPTFGNDQRGPAVHREITAGCTPVTTTTTLEPRDEEPTTTVPTTVVMPATPIIPTTTTTVVIHAAPPVTPAPTSAPPAPEPVAMVATTAPPSTELAYTGAPTEALTGIGLALVAIGATLARRFRGRA